MGMEAKVTSASHLASAVRVTSGCRCNSCRCVSVPRQSPCLSPGGRQSASKFGGLSGGLFGGNLGTRTVGKVKVALLCFDTPGALYQDLLRACAWRLGRSGAVTVPVTCERAFDACTSLVHLGDSASPALRDQTCRSCTRGQDRVIAQASAEPLSLRRSDIELYASCTSVLELLAWARRELEVSGSFQWLLADADHKGLALARAAYFDLAVSGKRRASDPVSTELLTQYLARLRELAAFDAWFVSAVRQEQFSVGYYVNGNYSLNIVARSVLDRSRSRAVSVEPPWTNISPFVRVACVPDRLATTPDALGREWIDRPVSRKDLRTALRALGRRVYGNSIHGYTALRSGLGVDLGPRSTASFLERHEGRLLSLFLSSSDEMDAHATVHGLGARKAETGADQRIAVETFVEAARANPEWGYIVRLHPRMAGAGRQGGVASEHDEILQAIEAAKPTENFHVLDGHSPVSSYLVGASSQRVFVTWSTIGLEFLVMGVPTVCLAPSLSPYPFSDVSTQASEDERVSAIRFPDKPSTVGEPFDPALVRWLSNAYVGQFWFTPSVHRIPTWANRLLRVILWSPRGRRLYSLQSRWVARFTRRVWRDGAVLSDSPPRDRQQTGDHYSLRDLARYRKRVLRRVARSRRN